MIKKSMGGIYNMDIFTVPEINLMCILDTSSKEKLLSELDLCKNNVYEPEMIELINETIKKLKKLTDKEFSEIGFFIADETDDIYG